MTTRPHVDQRDRTESYDSTHHDEAVTPTVSAGEYTTPSRAGLTLRSSERVVRK